MDPEKRIKELEKQVRQLNGQVKALLAVQGQGGTVGPSSGETRSEEPHHETYVHHLVEDVRKGMDRALGGEEGETLESRIGGIWMPRIAVVVAMTAVAVFAATTFRAEQLQPVAKVGIGYVLATAAIAYGMLFRRNRNFFPETTLGAGLAGLYFTTYAAFFVPAMRLPLRQELALPLLLGALVFLSIVVHLRRSQTAAGISLFLVYYTVVAAATGGQESEDLVYALATCGAIAVMTLLLHAVHRWMVFTWTALIGVYGVYIFFFKTRPAAFPLDEMRYFWLSNGFLLLCFVCFSLALIIGARKTGEYRRVVAPMAGANSVVFFTLTWLSVRQHYPEAEWQFRLWFAVLLAVFTAIAALAGPPRNYLVQIFAAKTVIMFTLALQALLSREQFVLAMAIECLALAFSYCRSGIVTFKILNLFMLLATFIGCFFAVSAPGHVVLGPYSVPASWFSCGGSAAVLCVTAWYYEKFVRRVRAEDRVVRSQWFLADSSFDVASSSAAMLHAAAAALVLLAVTMIRKGGVSTLPYLLALESVMLAGAGLVLRTPQIEASSVVLLIASHISYHFLLGIGKPGFQEQPQYALFTVLVALFTYGAGYLWERYLRRIEGGHPLEHHLLAAIPYLAATYMLTTLLGDWQGMEAPLAQNGVGVAVLFVGMIAGCPGMKAAAVLAFLIGSATFLHGLYDPVLSLVETAGFTYYFPAFLASYAVGERLFYVFRRRGATPVRVENHIRSLFVAIAAMVGVLGLSVWGGRNYLTLYWLAHGLAAMILGAVFRESRYRWAALVVFAIAVVRAFAYDFLRLPLEYKLVSFAVLSIALLIVSWAYSQYRARRLNAGRSRKGTERPADG
jgi:hypothetical protein